MVLQACGVRYLEHGERERWEQVARRVQELVGRTQYPWFRLSPVLTGLVIAIFDGDLEGAIKAADDLISCAEVPAAQRLGRLFAALVRGYLGRYDDALSGLSAAGQATGLYVVERAKRTAILAEIGRADEARTGLQQFLEQAAKGDELRHAPLAASACFLETAVALGEREAAATLLQALSSAALLFDGACIARLLGAAAALLGEREQAMRYYEQALEIDAKLRSRPELALTHLGIAELLLGDAGANLTPGPSPTRRGEDEANLAAPKLSSLSPTGGEDRREVRARAPEEIRAEALAHLDIAIPKLREMQMQPGLERALRLLDRASLPVASPPRAPLYPDGLSAREVEVLRLLAAGKSNQAIADELVLSLNTVYRHVNHIFTKIGATNRVEAAGYAHRVGLA